MILRKMKRAPLAWEAAVMGAMAKFFAVLLTYPAQTVKLRAQAGLKLAEVCVLAEPCQDASLRKRDASSCHAVCSGGVIVCILVHFVHVCGQKKSLTYL